MFRFLLGILIGVLLGVGVLHFLALRPRKMEDKALRNPAGVLYENFVATSDRVYVLSCQSGKNAVVQSHILHALGRSTLKELWRYPVNGFAVDDVQAVDDKVFLLRKQIHVVDANTGRRLLRYEINDGYVLSVAADKDHVFYQTHSGVHALDIQTGKIIWELPIGNYMLSPKLRISGDDLVFFASDNCVHVVDKRTGQTKLVAPFPKV